jgi:F-type H+-transporting ATPase subunit epsilon
MPGTIRCDIVSAQERLFSGQVQRCIVTGVGGELGIYPRHAPLMTKLRPGEVRLLKEDAEEITFVVGGGILEVMPHLVTILADTAIRAEDIDEAAALRAKQEAERVLRTRRSQMELAQAEIKLAEALAQLKLRERMRRKLKHS